MAANSSSIDAIWSKEAPTFDRLAAAAEQLVERLVLQSRGQVPPGRIEGPLGEAIAAETIEPLGQIVARVNRRSHAAGASQSRRQSQAPPAHSPLACGAFPGLASPQPLASSPSIRTRTVSSRGGTGVSPVLATNTGETPVPPGRGVFQGKVRWKISMRSICMVCPRRRR